MYTDGGLKEFNRSQEKGLFMYGELLVLMPIYFSSMITNGFETPGIGLCQNWNSNVMWIGEEMVGVKRELPIPYRF